MRKLKLGVKIVLSLVALFVVAILSVGIYYKSSLNPVDKNNTEDIKFTVNDGDAGITIINNLEKKNLIKSSLTAKIYLKTHKFAFRSGTYTLKKSYSLEKIFKVLEQGKPSVWITFTEGKRLTDFAKVVSEKFNYTEDEVMKKLDDKEYINTLIDKYSFITTDVLKEGIYHPLEGYIYADTYNFDSDETLEKIIETTLDTMEEKLNEIDFNKTNMSMHKILTLASVVELEGSAASDRNGIAGVFINRMNQNMSLGSDVTTYYGANKTFKDDLTISELNTCTPYNTRGNCQIFPIGPISSPSLSSIKAVINPTMSDNLFFVADKNGHTYFSKTNAEHEKIVADLKSQGLWYTYN